MPHRGLVLAAATLAVLVRGDLVLRRETISVDGVQYVAAARQFGAGAWRRGLASFYPPGYPLAIAAVTRLAGDAERAGLLVSAVSGVAAVWPLAALGVRAGLSTVGLGATLVGFAVSPYPARYAATVRSEALYGLLLLLAVWAVVAARDAQRTRLAAGGGVAVAAAYLVRPEGLFLALPLAAVLRQPRLVAVFVLAAGLGAAPYVAYLRHDTGRWLVSRKAANVLSLGIHESVGAGEVVSQHESDSVPLGRVLMESRGVLARKLAHDGLKTFASFAECLHFVYLPFVLLGLWQLGRTPGTVWRATHAVVWFYVAFFAAVYVDRRFYNGIVPLALLWGGVGAATARARWLPDRRGATAIAGTVLAATILAKTLYVRDAAAWVRAAGAAVRRAGGSGQRIAAADLRVSYYAGGWPVDVQFPLGAAALSGVMDGPARWLVVRDRDVEPGLLPQVATLSGLTLVATLPFDDGTIRILAVHRGE